MKIAFATRWLGVTGLLAILCGCAASNPVYRIEDRNMPRNMRGALFALPKTRLEFGYTKTTTTFVPGVHTALVERCMAGGLAGTVCDRLAALELESLRPSLGNGKCRSDGKETHVSYGTFTISASTVPDPEQIYAVQLRRNYFQNFDMDLEMDAFGIIGKGQASTTERAADDALGFVTGVARIALGLPPTPGDSARLAPADPASAASEDLDRLDALLLRRDELVAQVDADSLARSTALVAALNARIDVLEAKFTGTIAKKEALASAKFIPERPKQEPKKGEPEPTLANTPQHAFTFAPCGDNAETSRVVVLVSEACEKCSLVDGLPVPTSKESPTSAAPKTTANAPLPSEKAAYPADEKAPTAAPTTTVSAPSSEKKADYWSKQLNGNDDKLGWPYRLPVLARVHAGTCDVGGACPLSKLKMITETGIAQFGEVMRLPAGTGGRKSNIAATYTALGSLSKLEVDQEGQDATPIFTAAEALLNRPPKAPPPSETAVLQGEIALIQARQTLCKLIYGEADTRCVSANPPIE